MKRRRHTPEQIVRKLREVERLLGEGQTIAEAAKQVEISEQTYHRWRNQYGGMKADDARRLRELERENARLKRILAAGATGLPPMSRSSPSEVSSALAGGPSAAAAGSRAPSRHRRRQPRSRGTSSRPRAPVQCH